MTASVIPAPQEPVPRAADGISAADPRAARTWLGALALIGVLVPHLAHAVQLQCWIFLPVHFAPLLAGLALGLRAGAAVGAAVVLSEVLGGHLELARLVPMLFELFTYGLVAGLLARHVRSLGTALFFLIVAQLAGRLAYTIPSLILGKTLLRCLRGLFIAPWPGLVLQLVLIPQLVLWIRRSARVRAPDQTPGSLRRL